MKITVKDNSIKDELKVIFLSKELELAHEDYLKRQDEILTKLYTIWRSKDVPAIYRKWIQQAAKFIVEKEI